MKKLILYALLPCACLLTQNDLRAQASNTAVKIKYIDSANMDWTVKPGDNFSQYANGTWLKNNPVPASKTRWGSFNMLIEENSKRLRTLCEDAAANDTNNTIYQRVGDLYASAMDSAAIEKLGSSPIQPELKRLAALSTKEQILTEIATERTKGIGGILFSFSIGQDDRNVNEYIPGLGQGGISLPDRDYYLKADSRYQMIRAAYVNYVADMFKLVDDDSVTAKQKANAIVDLETSLARAEWSRVEMRDPIKTYNKYSLASFSETTPGLDWKMLLTKMKVPNADSILVDNPSFFKAADSLYTSLPVDTWKAYLEWNVIKSSDEYLSSAFVNKVFEFSKLLSGQKQITPRWQRMAGLVDRSLGELLGQLYVDKYFNDAAKQRMLALVQNIQSTFGDRIQRVTWMTDSTKQKALEKLHAIINKIGFPDKWETYPGVVINKNDLIGNLRSISQWRYNKNVNRMGKPVDKTEWGMTPPTINAYYNPSNNEIVFPAGILQFPFFDFGADDAVNYGGIAAVIGHELTHGFDDQGRQYGADGNLKDWWSKTDATNFTERADKVVAQFNAYTVNDTIHVNGKLTLGENLADLGGINIAYEAFKKTPEGKSNKKIDGFTPDQRFFLSWAQVWRTNILPEAAAMAITIDPHSPGVYRCNGPITNLDAWYAAFNVQSGDKMYKPEDQRIKVW
jgi:putative endopeptidase